MGVQPHGSVPVGTLGQKNKEVKFLKIFRKMKKVKIFKENLYELSLNISTFSFFEKNQKFHILFFIFFDRSQKKKSELKKKVEYSFDVKNWDLSIYDVFSEFWAL